jgi:glycosyltransferase involved in cell wall biosynthesis
MTPRRRVGLLATHPIQYYSPWYRALARLADLQVYYCHRQSGADHARTEFGVAFEWDLPLLDGYRSRFLPNRARRPDVTAFGGCDTPEIMSIIRRERFDAFVVIGWGFRSCWQAMAACWASGTPLLVRGDSHLLTPRSRLKRLFKEAAYRSFIPRFDAYLVVGERNRAYYRHYGADERRMFCTPHAVDNQFFGARADALRPARAALRASWGLPADAVVFLFAGKLVPRKRPHDFVLAIEAAARRNPRIYGLVAGDGLLRAELEALARERDIPVRFAGFLNQTEMPRAYSAADALVISSDANETWGLVVNEALASGLPAIASDAVGCAPDLVLPGRTGEQYPLGDVAALAGVLAALAAEPGRLAALGRAASRHIQRFSVELAAAGTYAAISAVAPRRGRIDAA